MTNEEIQRLMSNPPSHDVMKQTAFTQVRAQVRKGLLDGLFAAGKTAHMDEVDAITEAILDRLSNQSMSWALAYVAGCLFSAGFFQQQSNQLQGQESNDETG